MDTVVAVLPIQYDVVIACVYNVVCAITMTFLLPVCVFNDRVGDLCHFVIIINYYFRILCYLRLLLLILLLVEMFSFYVFFKYI